MAHDVKDPNRVTGCILRIWSANADLLNEIRRHFQEQEHGHSEVLRASGIPLGPSAYVLYHERMGNLDLFGWLHSIGSDLEDSGIHTSDSAIRVGIELVY